MSDIDPPNGGKQRASDRIAGSNQLTAWARVIGTFGMPILVSLVGYGVHRVDALITQVNLIELRQVGAVEANKGSLAEHQRQLDDHRRELDDHRGRLEYLERRKP